MQFVVVTATRSTPDGFAQTMLGRTLATYSPRLPLRARVFFENSQGLASCYNTAVSEAAPDDIVVLVHDDVLIADLFWAPRAMHDLDDADVLGVAGNTRRLPRQPSWAFVDDRYTWDDKAMLSGMIGHGEGFPCEVSRFGPVPRRCVLLDGALLIARAGTLKRVPFDESFGFHFYDMDFCRQSEAAGLKMSTTAIGIVHASVGDFYTPDWHADYRRYLAKWGE